MLAENCRAFKEWAVACEAISSGKQTMLIRKGGVREENGVFTMSDSEFLLLPTYEHQKASLLKPEYLPSLARIEKKERNVNEIVIETYVVVEQILTNVSETQLDAVSEEYPWNADYVKLRFDFNPYDPLFVLLLRAYRLLKPVALPLRKDYIGCKSWVSLETSLPVGGAIPVLSDEEHRKRQMRVLSKLTPGNA